MTAFARILVLPLLLLAALISGCTEDGPAGYFHGDAYIGGGYHLDSASVRDAGGDACIGGACVDGDACVGSACLDLCVGGNCDACIPDCAGKCGGAGDGCGGICTQNDCQAGCCDENLECVAYAAQGNKQCGSSGQACVDCSPFALTCDSAAHACLTTLANDAQFVSQSGPGLMMPGQTATVSITMRNVGTATWTAATDQKLGAQNPQDNERWGMKRVTLGGGDAIAPGQSKTFSFSVTAPATPGLYNFQWRMVQEFVEWFGEYSAYLPVWVSSASPTVCEAVRSLAGTATNATPGIQGCIDAASAGAIVELPAGTYSLDGQLRIDSVGIMLRTEGTNIIQPACTPTGHSCAELRASTSFGDTGGILLVTQAGTVVDHIVLHGNRVARTLTPSGAQCSGGSNIHGYNMRMTCSRCALTNSVTQRSLCGTGCEVTGSGTEVVIWRTTVAENGVHNAHGLWADGITVHDYTHSSFSENEFYDNTDIDFIFGGCEHCIIQRNVLRHSPALEGGAFAALMLHAWPSTSGNFNFSDTSGNTIDCGSNHRCGIGLYLGSDAWYITNVFGGNVHHNTITRAEQGLLIDDAYNMAVWNNPVTAPASSTKASCGVRATTAYGMGTTSHDIDTSLDTLGTTYTPQNWDGCIPNWWE